MKTKKKLKRRGGGKKKQSYKESSVDLDGRDNVDNFESLKPWERRCLGLLQWSYAYEMKSYKVRGYLSLFEPLKCEETLVRMDQNDVRAVLKIMGYNWPADQKKRGAKKKKSSTKKWGTKDFKALVDSIGREEDELVRWWRREFCVENVQPALRRSVRQYPADLKPTYFKTVDEEERLWKFAERMEASAMKSKLRSRKSNYSKASRKSNNSKASRTSILKSTREKSIKN